MLNQKEKKVTERNFSPSSAGALIGEASENNVVKRNSNVEL